MKDNLTPGILSMLPMFYVGWSDSVLSPTEMKLIHEKIDSSDFLSDTDKKYLIKWTNPLRPPDEKIFKTWVKVIREHGNNVPDGAKMSLVSLGLEMAKSSIHYKNDELWKSPQTKKALLDIEAALGVKHTMGTGILEYTKTLAVSPCKDCSFDIAAMKTLLDEPFEEIKDQIRTLLRDPLFKITHHDSKES
jgi:acyl-CoA oxidase